MDPHLVIILHSITRVGRVSLTASRYFPHRAWGNIAIISVYRNPGFFLPSNSTKRSNFALIQSKWSEWFNLSLRLTTSQCPVITSNRESHYDPIQLIDFNSCTLHARTVVPLSFTMVNGTVLQVESLSTTTATETLFPSRLYKVTRGRLSSPIGHPRTRHCEWQSFGWWRGVMKR